MKREAFEEDGLLIEPIRIIGVYGGENYRLTYRNGDEVEYVMVVFECEIIDGELNPNNEENEPKFFPKNQLPPLVNPYPSYIFSSNQQERAHFEV